MPARILVIEDNEDNRELMMYILKAFGHTVFAACDGEEGLGVARRELPDLILSDLQMPKMDGYEVLRAIRKDPRLAARPLIAVTSYAMRGDRERVLSAGFDGYISKPILPEDFVGRLETFLKPAQHSVARSETTPAGNDPATVGSHTTILAVDNSEVNLSLIQNTLTPFGYKVLTVGSAREALGLALANPPDLILSDLHMPEVDGYEFFRTIRADSELSHIPFVIISSTIWGKNEVARALSIGVSRFILRPIEPFALVAEIESCLDECRRRTDADSKNTAADRGGANGDNSDR